MSKTFLNRLVNGCSDLSEKVQTWSDAYTKNTARENVTQGLDIYELVNQTKLQLEGVLEICGAEGGRYCLQKSPYYPFSKYRYPPYLGHHYPYDPFCGVPDYCYTDTLLAKDREIRALTLMVRDLEKRLDDKVLETQDLTKQLEETQQEMEKSNNDSQDEKEQLETEINELKEKIDTIEQENDQLKSQIEESEIQNEDLKNTNTEIEGKMSALTTELDLVTNDLRLFHLPYYHHHYPYPHHHHHHPPSQKPSLLCLESPGTKAHNEALIKKWNDLFSVDRLDAMSTLGTYDQDRDNNQRILSCIVTEAFKVCQSGGISGRSSRGKSRSSNPLDSETNADKVIETLRENTKLKEPNAAEGYRVILPFIRDVCRLAGEMSLAIIPFQLDLAFDGDLFNQTKYRRSFDSEYSTDRIHHYVWPCLMQNGVVQSKGEAVTRN